jgi:hypothetical protein
VTIEINTPASLRKDANLVTRSTVTPDKHYGEHKEVLRHDFFYSCAYCTMAEYEAQGFRFTIDHYEPRKSRPDLVNTYDNLMYACGECNLRKGDRNPPSVARADGHRFFRADEDHRQEHFRKLGDCLEGLTNTGSYTIKAIDLNRRMVRKLRELRERLKISDRFIAEGIMALRTFRFDQLPKDIRVKFVRHRREAMEADAHLAAEIDNLLRSRARSVLLDAASEPEEKGRSEERLASLRGTEALYPGNWRAPRNRPVATKS